MKDFINNEVRTDILQIINVNYPSTVGSKVIMQLLNEQGHKLSDDDLEKHLHYLSEKGYIVIADVDNKVVNFKRIFAKITTDGIDLLEKLM